MTLNECFERRQLRKIAPDVLKASKSVETAKIKLEEAKKLSDAGFDKMAVVVAYSSMFHSARALLYKDGVQEKSHYCLVVYVREEYARKGLIPTELVTTMDAFRQERHDAMYGLEETKTTREHCQNAIQTAQKLMDAVQKIIEK